MGKWAVVIEYKDGKTLGEMMKTDPANIEKYMEDLCTRVDARDSFKEKSERYLVPSKYKKEPTGVGAAIHMIDEIF